MTAASFPPKVQRPFSFLASPDAGWKSFPAIAFLAPPYSLRSSFPAKTARTNAKEYFPNGLSDFPAHEDPRPLGLFQLPALAAGQDLQLSDPKNTPEKGAASGISGDGSLFNRIQCIPSASYLSRFPKLLFRLSQFSKIVPIKTSYLRYAVCGCCLCIKNADCYRIS